MDEFLAHHRPHRRRQVDWSSVIAIILPVVVLTLAVLLATWGQS